MHYAYSLHEQHLLAWTAVRAQDALLSIRKEKHSLIYCSHLGIEEGLGHMILVVEVEEDGAGARVALKGVHAPVSAVEHEVKAQLPAYAGRLAETLDPLPDLHSILYA